MNIHFRKLADRIFASLATKKAHRIAKLLFRISIRLLGYNNYGDADRTGEKYFLNYLIDRNPKFCIDIGANIGTYSDFILQNSDAQVLAFEPLPKSFEEAEKLIRKYPGRFRIVNKGVSNKEGELILHFGNQTESATFSSEANQIPYIAELNQEKILVPVISLDRYISDHPELPWNECNLLKIDTEGFEVEVILGAKNFITKSVPD
jgi:FkbM family methyltransferase